MTIRYSMNVKVIYPISIAVDRAMAIIKRLAFLGHPVFDTEH